MARGKEKKRKTKIDKKFWSIIALVVLMVMAAIYAETMYGDGKVRDFVMDVVPTETSKSNTTTVENTMTIGENTSSEIIAFGESFLLSTKDGVKFYNSIGDQKWSDTFTMENPETIYEGEYVAIGDMNGRSIRVYNQLGLAYTLQLDGSPVQFELNENGYLSVIFKSQDEYYVRVYNQNGILLKGRVEAETGVYPMFSDVSDDNKSFCVTYLDTNDIKMVSKVVFYYINPGDSDAYTDSVFAGIEMEDEVVTKVKYMEDDMVFAISDTKLRCITTAGSESWSMDFTNWMSMCDFSNKSYAVLVLGASLPNEDGRESGTVLMMSTKGKETGTYQMDDVGYLRASDKGVVVGDGKTFVGLTYKGAEEWQHQVTGTVKDVLTLSSLNRVMVVSTLQAEIYTLRGVATQTTTEDAWMLADDDDTTDDVAVNEDITEDATEDISEGITEDITDDVVEEIVEEVVVEEPEEIVVEQNTTEENIIEETIEVVEEEISTTEE